MLEELIRAFALTFLAEMGDKSQILAMTFATQYRMKEVFIGLFIGILVNHGIAVALGRVVLNFIPLNYIQIISGFVFIIFAYMSLLEDDEEDTGRLRKMGPILTVAITFFLGELGDKTQIMAMTLSAEARYPLVVLAGTTLGMMATSSLGIFIGSKLGGKIPDLYIKLTSSLIFIAFGNFKLVEMLGYGRALAPVLISLGLEAYLVIRLLKSRSREELSAMQKAAEKLYEEVTLISQTIDGLCLGEEVCGSCQGERCFLGYIRGLLNRARENQLYEVYDSEDFSNLIKKDYDKNKVLEALALIIVETRENNWEENDKLVINIVADYLEEYLLGEKLLNDLGTRDYYREFRSYNNELGVRLMRIVSSS